MSAEKAAVTSSGAKEKPMPSPRETATISMARRLSTSLPITWMPAEATIENITSTAPPSTA